MGGAAPLEAVCEYFTNQFRGYIMGYTEFCLWFEQHKPELTPDDDFKDFLAMLGANLLENASKNSGDSVGELVNGLFLAGSLVQ